MRCRCRPRGKRRSRIAKRVFRCSARPQISQHEEGVMVERKSVNFPGFSHQTPIPNASRVGNIVMSSVIGGSNPGTRDLPPTLEAQVANVFGYNRAAHEADGGTPENIVKVDFLVRDPATQ